MTRPGWNGPRVTRARAFVLARDSGICWLCGHGGANSLDHIKPASTHPELEWNPENWKAAHLGRHGNDTGCQTPGCTCPGNAGRGNRTPPGARNAPPTRAW